MTHRLSERVLEIPGVPWATPGETLLHGYHDREYNTSRFIDGGADRHISGREGNFKAKFIQNKSISKVISQSPDC